MGSFLITGTDTGVGKTFVTYNLAYTLRSAGVRVGCFKPVETGVSGLPADGALLAGVEGEEPLSLDRLRDHFEKLQSKYEVLLVEGAGGIAVPLLRNYTYGDLARDWDLEIVVVGRAGLGTLNHTLC